MKLQSKYVSMEAENPVSQKRPPPELDENRRIRNACEPILSFLVSIMLSPCTEVESTTVLFFNSPVPYSVEFPNILVNEGTPIIHVIPFP